MTKPTSYSKLIFGIFVLGLLLLIGWKAVNEGWFSAPAPLELDGKPALVLFNRYKGCECELVVYEAAEDQIEHWSEGDRSGVPVFIFNLDQRSDLKKQYQILRAPTLILLDASGDIILRQDQGISDLEPLNLPLFEEKIKEVLNGS